MVVPNNCGPFIWLNHNCLGGLLPPMRLLVKQNWTGFLAYKLPNLMVNRFVSFTQTRDSVSLTTKKRDSYNPNMR